MKEVYQSKKSLQNKPFSVLRKDFLAFIKDCNKVYCSVLGRLVFMSKQPEATLKRKNAKYRLESFFVGIDILKKSKTIRKWNESGQIGYEIIGFSSKGKKVVVHLREEKDSGKDKKCFFISVFHK